ncbi:restriction endonuclease subunit S [Bradyrhizobium lablabi]|uniref:restriction endonuclease subunit S n=1 Tax=Bradyrhizobium lablabi TaxID=722472 RepID=UPI001BAB2257|nr:restriction endonuclease subunit S [Bradyrhizobium lablabi]MBR1123905.1 restriction endonuclease subunit S [Bradyrhizobium lablabi]
MNVNAAPMIKDCVEFHRTTIGAICDQFDGEVQTGPFGSQLHASDYSDEGIPVVMPQDMLDGEISCANIARVDASHARRLSQHRLRVGDVVFSRRGDVSRFAVVTEQEEGWLCGTGSIRIRLNFPNLDMGYLRHFLKRDEVGSWLLYHAKGVTMPNLNTSIIRAIPFFYPPLNQQRRIATILDKADRLRRKGKRELELLGSLNQATFLDMFGDTVRNTKGWIEKPLAAYESFLTSGSRGWAKYYSAAGKAFIRIQNLRNGDLSTNDMVFVDPPQSAEAERTTVRGGDVLISITADLGRTAVVPDTLDGQAHINQHIALVRVTGINPIYLSMYLASAGGEVQFRALNRQGVKAGLNFDDIRSLRILEPPIHLQATYAARTTHIRKIIDKAALAAMKFSALFSSLQSRAFSGQL